MDYIENHFKHHPFIFGLILMLVSAFIVIILIYRNESFKMKNHSTASWQVLLSSWSIAIILFIQGLSLVLRNDF
uniref:hypothetical protein n=1 Tax=Flavobacterium sp. TaxID=239 RepID=UPI00404A2833